jgi:uncharacterized protein YdhG (YjbR/CyaY superfamily)
MKMQNVSFKNVDEFLEYLPDSELKIVQLLRSLVFDCIPMATEHLSYNVPYYKVNKNICFIWPASILWGKKQTYTGVRFGLTNGHMIADEIEYFSKGDRKQVYWRDFSTVKEIDIDLLKSFIFDALMVDEKIKSKKAKRETPTNESTTRKRT